MNSLDQFSLLYLYASFVLLVVSLSNTDGPENQGAIPLDLDSPPYNRAVNVISLASSGGTFEAADKYR